MQSPEKITKVLGLTGNESNTYNGQSYEVFYPSDWSMPVDPCHEFLCVVEQLSGHHGGPYHRSAATDLRRTMLRMEAYRTRGKS
jgi:hypothetical protein